MATTTARIELITPLGEELLFHGMHTQEEVSRLGEYQLDLLSMNKEIDRDKILGAKVTLKMLMQDDKVRYFNGFVSRFSTGGQSVGKYTRYHAVVVPWLWFLTRTADCRIFQDKTVRQIVEEVFADHADLADFTFELTEKYRTWNYCVQYRETDFNFVSRLLEHEGIYYYFRHTDGHHTLVLTDSTDKHEPFPGYEKLQFIKPQAAVRPGIEYISAWHVTRQVQPGVYAHDDYDFEKPSVDLTTTRTLPRKYTPSSYEMYDYPGEYLQKSDGVRYAHVRIDEFGAQFEVAEATTNYRGISVGSRMELEGRGDKFDGKYIIIGATHTLESSQYETGDVGGSDFRCTFAALSTEQQFRARRVTPKPFVQGPQTAVVVGPAGDEIYTDKYGRVKVQFHWDRRGKKDENSSCWVRVSHPWAGKGWGSVATPRIGQEVIVSFLEGDADRPIITGRVYNEENLPPFGFPAGAVISGVKSDSHKAAGYNEISCDDTGGTEKITIHGQFDMNTTVEHDQTTTVHNCRTDVVDVDDSETVGNNQTWQVGVNRDATIGSNETLTVGSDRTKVVGANESITIGSNRDGTVGGSESLLVALQRTHTVGVNETITVGGAQEVTVGGMQAITVGAIQNIAVGANQTTSVGGNQSNTIGSNQTTNIAASQTTKVNGDASMSVGGNENHGVVGLRKSEVGKDDTLDVGKNLIVTAGESISLTTGSATIVMKKDGTISIKGKDITLEGSGQITVKASKDVVVKGKKILQN